MASSLASHSGHKRQQTSNDIDRLSNLQEWILLHILSLLPTEDAVSTSLLSTRWKFLWRNIHKLFFSDNNSLFSRGENVDRNRKFANFIKMVLHLLNKQPIDEFSLEILKYSVLYDVSAWITAAVAKNVKELEFSVTVSYASDTCIQLPCSLFTCKTLEVLVLRGVMSLNVPNMVCLPKLQILHLEKVNFQSDESVRNLISGCSSLETLYIARDVYDDVVTFTISSPTLRNLTFRFYEEDSPFPEELDYKLEINAPALSYLDVFDNLSRDFSVRNLCSLDEANVDLNIDESLIDYDRYSKAVVKFLQGVYNVKHLSLRGDTLKALSHAGASPRFRRLTRLTVEAECCKWSSLLNLVEGSNKLEFLTFFKGFDHQGPHVRCWSKLKKVPICLLSCLETMSMDGFEGQEDELEMVAYILKNAKVLRTMTIDAAYPLDIEARFQLLQKVSKFPRGSEECEITFS